MPLRASLIGTIACSRATSNVAARVEG